MTVHGKRVLPPIKGTFFSDQVQTREETEDNYSFIHSFECMVKSPEDCDKAVAWVPWDGYYSACCLDQAIGK